MAVSEVFRFLLDADGRGAVREFKRVSAASQAELAKMDASSRAAATGFAAQASALSSGLKAAVIGYGGIVAAQALQSSVDAAADLETAMKRVDATFKGAADDVKEFAKGAADIGLAADAAAQGAAVFGELLTQLGFDVEEAAGYSQQLLEIAAGFAAMNNADPSAVVQAVAAAFRGEYDSLQRYLPAINDAIIRQKAVDLGYAETAKSADEYAKAQAALVIITEKGARAQRFLAEVQDTASFQSRKLQANVRNLSAEIGDYLIPVVADTVAGLNTLIGLLDRLKGYELSFPGLDVDVGLFDLMERYAESFVPGLSTLRVFMDTRDDMNAQSEREDEALQKLTQTWGAYQRQRDRAAEVEEAATARMAEANEEHAKYLKMVRDAQAEATKADKERMQVIRDELWRRAAEQAEEYQEAVEKAADANEAAAEAAEDVVDAERRLVDSKRTVVDAERRVADARQKAVDLLDDERKAVEDLAAARRGAARDVERAQIRLEGERRDTREAGNSNTMADWLDQLDRQRLAELDLEDALEDAADKVDRAQERIADVQDARQEVLTRDIPDALQALEDARVDEFAASIDLAEAAAARAATALEALAASAAVDPTAMRQAQESAMRAGASTVNRPDAPYIENQVFNIQSVNPEAVAAEIDRRFGAAVAGTGQHRMRVAV